MPSLLNYQIQHQHFFAGYGLVFRFQLQQRPNHHQDRHQHGDDARMVSVLAAATAHDVPVGETLVASHVN